MDTHNFVRYYQEKPKNIKWEKRRIFELCPNCPESFSQFSCIKQDEYEVLLLIFAGFDTISCKYNRHHCQNHRHRNEQRISLLQPR